MWHSAQIELTGVDKFLYIWERINFEARVEVGS
jgi:hypothetical protein